MIYQNKLEPHNGLFLEIYADNAREKPYGNDAQDKEGIKYIELSILKET